MKKLFVLFLFLMGLHCTLIAQTDSVGIEITIIDSYITPELPHTFVLSFFTSDSCTSTLKLGGKYTYKVSEKPTDSHKIEVDLSNLKFDSLLIHYTITVTGKNKKESLQSFETILSDESLLVKNRDLNLFNICCLGGTIFGLPSPTYVIMNGKSYFALSKEIPLFSFYSGGYNYPSSYIGIEYKYIPKFEAKHQLGLGYKLVFQLPVIEYITPGVNYFTNFLGNYGLSFETSIGLFRFYNVFTFYTRYRYNQFIGDEKSHFHEISIGLYSNFFSLNL
jgi:hypothetical protein